jgi:hypothetical protein
VVPFEHDSAGRTAVEPVVEAVVGTVADMVVDIVVVVFAEIVVGNPDFG